MDIQLLKEVSDFLEEFYEDENFEEELWGEVDLDEDVCCSVPMFVSECRPAAGGGVPPFVPEKNFSDTLFDMIDARGITDGQAASRSGIDRRLMSKIRNNPKHTPTKKTIFSFAVGLRLSEEETEELLMKAGYAFSNSSRFDLILQYFIREKNYDIWEINEVLHYYGLEPVCC